VGDENRRETAIGRSVGRVWAGLLEALQYRLDLLALELKEEKEHLFGLLVGVLLVAGLVFMAFLTLNCLLIVTFWDHRVLLSGGLFLLYLLAALIAGWQFRRRLRATPPPLSATIEEFRKDRSAMSSRK
jgi:uncharacterized membrane protein YqjE